VFAKKLNPLEVKNSINTSEKSSLGFKNLGLAGLVSARLIVV